MKSSRRIDDARRPRPRTTIAVLSGKGGVGKTNIAVNLALCLQSRGMQVVLADLDMGLANADVLLGAQPQCDLRDVLAHRRQLADALTPAVGGVRFVTAATGALATPPNDIERARLGDLLARIPADVLLLDCAAGIDENVMHFAQFASIALVVTTPEPTAITDAYAVVKTLSRRSYGGSVRVLVNMVESRPEARDVYQRLRATCENFLKLPLADAGYLLHDTHVELAVRQRTPFVICFPRCSASMCATAVAARLVGGQMALRQSAGFLRRVVGMFA